MNNMKLKNKRHIIIPIAIVIYTLVIAIFFGLKSNSSDTMGAFYLIIGVNLVLAVVLYFILKKREEYRNKNTK